MARIIEGVWFPTDVLGGIVTGFLGSWLGSWLLGHSRRAVTWIRAETDRMGFG